MNIGTKVRTLYEYSEIGVIVKPRKGETTPNAEWFIVRFDDDGAKLCIHRSMLAVCNVPSRRHDHAGLFDRDCDQCIEDGR